MDEFGRYTATPLFGTVSPTGVVLGPLIIGEWEIACDVDCYWVRGDSSLAVGDVNVDESTPTLSNKIFGGYTKIIDVVAADADAQDYVAFKSVSGGQTGPVVISKKS
jgi:hypothetical protein